MSNERLTAIIEAAFRDRAAITSQTQGDVRASVDEALGLLDSGKLRVAEQVSDAAGPEAWHVNQWLKKAVLLSFRLNDMTAIPGAPGGRQLVGQGALQIRRLGRRGIRDRGGSAPCRIAWCAAPPISRPTSSSCRAS